MGRIELIGNSEVRAREEQTITVKVTNGTAIGVVEGYIKKDFNIERLKVSSSYNGWMTTYNEEQGCFNAFNPEGTIEGEVIKITYVLKDNANKATITLSDLKLTTIEYDTIELQDEVTKTITIAQEVEDTVQGTNTTKPANDDTIFADKVLPKTGTSISMFVLIIVMAIVTIVTTITWRKDKY